MSKKLTLLSLVAALVLSACAALPNDARIKTGIDGEAYGLGGGGYADSIALPVESEAIAAAEAPRALADASQSATSADRLVIKNANLSLVVKEPAAAVDSIGALAESLGGFVVGSNVYQTSTDAAGNRVMQARITIRVPADKLQTALSQIKGLAVTVNSENTSGEDVTAQYTDLESRLRNLEAAEAQLQKIMDGAIKTEDVLAVYHQLVYIREQIEQVKGQMKYYRESAAMSLISVDLIPDVLSQPIRVGGWKAEGVAKEALEALVRAFQGIATALIWGAVYVLPLGLTFGIPAYVGVRVIGRRLRRPAKAPTA
jgi:hypothetical protein